MESSGFGPISSIVLRHFPGQTVENQDKYIMLAYLRARILTRALTTTKQYAIYSVILSSAVPMVKFDVL